MEKTNNPLAEEKYKLLTILDKTESIWKTKKSLTVAELVKDSKKAVKAEDITTIISLSRQLKQENEAELKHRLQIKEEKARLFHDIELADSIDNKSFEFMSVLKRAKSLSQKQKVELNDLKELKRNIAALFIYRSGGVVMSGTDNIIISKFINLHSVGILML